MRRKFFDHLLYLYVWIDVALFMTAERITAVLPERKSL
jgi:hypothetical protein